jgi:hypothetical protein
MGRITFFVQNAKPSIVFMSEISYCPRKSFFCDVDI